MDLPPVVNPYRLQNELDRLMEKYESRDAEKTQKNFEACFSVVLLMMAVGMGIQAITAQSEIWIVFAAILVIGLGLARSVIRFWLGRTERLEQLDRELCELAPRLAVADRLSLSLEDRNRLHDRLFNCSPEAVVGIVGVLEVAGNKESLHYLKSLAGSGFYAHLLSPRITPEVRAMAGKAARSLKVKLERETHAETLLRASGSVNANELLRPVGPSGSTPAEQLLRAEDRPE